MISFALSGCGAFLVCIHTRRVCYVQGLLTYSPLNSALEYPDLLFRGSRGGLVLGLPERKESLGVRVEDVFGAVLDSAVFHLLDEQRGAQLTVRG